MNELAKYKNYLWIIAMLVLAQFVWVPQWGAKQEKWALLSSVERTMSRATQLLKNKEQVLEKKQTLEAVVAERRAQLQRAENINRYQLAQQSKIESLVAGHGLTVAQVSWRDGLAKNQIHTQQIELQLTGSLKQYIEFLAALQRQYQYFEITMADVAISGQNELSAGAVTVRLGLTVRVEITSTNVASSTSGAAA